MAITLGDSNRDHQGVALRLESPISRMKIGLNWWLIFVIMVIRSKKSTNQHLDIVPEPP